MTQLNRKNIILALAVLVMAAGVTLLIESQAQAAEIKTITINGRTEEAVCEVEYSLPPIEVCKSESWLCRIVDGAISCETTR
jgi:type 1 fimbria pilin